MPVRTHRVVLVTGAARRLGRLIALGCAREGWDVAVHCHCSAKEARQVAAEVRGMGRRAVVIRGDLRRPADCRRVVREAKRRLGRLDALVNSAADFFPTPLPKVSERDWDHLMDLNLKGSFFCAQEAAKVMRQGHILQMADVGAFLPWTRYAPYAVSKAGTVAMVRILARAWAPRIRVNAVAPGRVLLPGDRDLEGRTVMPDRVVRTALMLLKTDLTGRVIPVV